MFISVWSGADMNCKWTIKWLVKTSLHMTLIGSRVKFIVVLSFGWEREKPIALHRKSVGNAGFVNLILSVRLTPIVIVHQALQKPVWIYHWARESILLLNDVAVSRPYNFSTEKIQLYSSLFVVYADQSHMLLNLLFGICHNHDIYVDINYATNASVVGGVVVVMIHCCKISCKLIRLFYLCTCMRVSACCNCYMTHTKLMFGLAFSTAHVM